MRFSPLTEPRVPTRSTPSTISRVAAAPTRGRFSTAGATPGARSPGATPGRGARRRDAGRALALAAARVERRGGARGSPSSRSPRADARRARRPRPSHQLGEWFGEVARKLTGVWSRVGYPRRAHAALRRVPRGARALCDERVAAEERPARARGARARRVGRARRARRALEDVRDDAPASDEFEGPSRTSRTSLERGSYLASTPAR